MDALVGDRLVLDFSDPLDPPHGGDAEAIRREIDEAVEAAIEAAPGLVGEPGPCIAVATAVAEGRVRPLEVSVVAPVRRPIEADVPLDEAERLISGYRVCEGLYRSVMGEPARCDARVRDGVLRAAISAGVPEASELAIDGIMSLAATYAAGPVAVATLAGDVCDVIGSVLEDAGDGEDDGEPLAEAEVEADAEAEAEDEAPEEEGLADGPAEDDGDAEPIEGDTADDEADADNDETDADDERDPLDEVIERIAGE